MGFPRPAYRETTIMLVRKLFVIVLVIGLAAATMACPFCASEQRTLTEEMADASVILLAKLAQPSEASQKLADAGVPYAFVDPETGAAKFTVESVLKGETLMKGVAEVEAIYFGEPKVDEVFFLRGVGEPPDWAIPLPLSPLAAEYVPKLAGLPPSGADRLAFFQEYLEHADPLLAQDAYDEFARAPYKDVEDLAPRMDREQLRAWVEDVAVSPSRRRLFLTMLGVCGEPEDVERLERMLTSDARVLGPATDAAALVAMAAGGPPVTAMTGELVRFAERQRKLGLDAHVACYLTLAGKHGDVGEALDLVDRRYLRDREADYSHVYAVLQALRFLAEEQQDLVPPDRLLASARLLLDNSEFADQVIPDLARWEDWSVLERLAEMYRATFNEGDPDAPIKYVREPIVTYLDVANEQSGEVGERAATALADIEPLDPQAVERARSLRAFGFLAQARSRAEDSLAAAKPRTEVDSATPSESTEPAGDIAVDPPEDVKADLEALADEETELPTEAGVAEAPSAEPALVAETPAAKTTPPSRVLLVGAPLAGAALLFGLFWLILRSGVS